MSVIEKRTRGFSFPNKGHSVQKLVESLQDLGNTPVVLRLEVTFNCCGRFEYDVYYVEREDGVPASSLATAFPALGDRFAVEPNLSIKFYYRG